MTSTLIGAGTEPRCAIGTSNTAEFVVAIAVSSAFLWALLTGRWADASELAVHAWAVAGLIIGGVTAAPLAAWLTRRLPMRPMTWIVGAVVMILAAYQAAQLWGLI